MAGLKELSILRDKIKSHEDELRKLRERRDRMAITLAKNGFPERVVGQYAGIGGPYVNQLKRQARERGVTR